MDGLAGRFSDSLFSFRLLYMSPLLTFFSTSIFKGLLRDCDLR